MPSNFSANHSNLVYALENAQTDEEVLTAAKNLRNFRSIVKSIKPYGYNKPTPEEAITLLSDSLNGRDDATEFFVALDREHRTLQQKIYGLFFSLIYFMGCKKDNEIDLRNQSARDTCAKIKTLCDENDIYLGRQPFI